MVPERLKQLYAEIAAHTFSMCQKMCTRKSVTRCCCNITCNDIAKILEDHGYPVPPRAGDVRFMGKGGCILEPWQRPFCATYHCWLRPPFMSPPGWREQESEWLKKYAQLRDEIELLKAQLGSEALPDPPIPGQ